MRRSIFFVSAALLFTGGFSLLSAQHGGGGHSTGAHISHSPAPSASHNVYPTAPTPIGLQPQYSGYTGINPGALNTRPLPIGPVRVGVGRRPVYGIGRSYGYYGYYPYFPLFSDYDTASYNDPGYYNNASVPQQPMYPEPDPASAQLSEQVDRLSQEVDALRNDRTQDNSAPRPRYNAPPLLPDDEAAAVPITLILRDGKQLQLKSYAVMGQTIWDFSSQPAKKITLASIDLDASQKATEAAGAEFPDLH